MKKIKFFKKDTLLIANKIIISNKSFIQIRNITRIWHGKPEVEVPIFKILCVFIFSIFLFSTPLSGGGVFILLIDLAVVGYYVYIYCNYTLNFELSSGEVYAFTSLKRDFLEESYVKVKEIMNAKDLSNQKIEINFNKCEIQTVTGDNNIVNKGDYNVINKGDHNKSEIKYVDKSKHVDESTNDSFNTNLKINYDKLTDELSKLILDHSLSKEDIEIIQIAKQEAEAKNEQNLKSSLRKLSSKSLSIICNTSAFITLAEFIKQFIK